VFQNDEELRQYILENYTEVTDRRIDQSHWDLQCTRCKITRGFQVIRREVTGDTATEYFRAEFVRDFEAPVTYVFRCPVCKAFKQWILYELRGPNEKHHFFRVTSVPSEGLEDIDELPADPPALRTAYRQATRAMDANAPLAAAAMFRRALQVITRDLLGATRNNLGRELKQVVGRKYKGAVVTNDFATVAYIIKEAGNQGAHPDDDPDLLDFTPRDAQDLQDIFMELVSELFIIPAAAKKAKDDFLARRKIPQKP